MAGTRLAPHSAQKIVPSYCLDWQLLQTCIVSWQSAVDSRQLQANAYYCWLTTELSSGLALIHVAAPHQAARAEFDAFASFIAGAAATQQAGRFFLNRFCQRYLAGVEQACASHL